MATHSRIPSDQELPVVATEEDPYRRSIWGESALDREGGQIVVLTSRVDGRQLRLWLYTTENFEPYSTVNVDADDPTQLIISDSESSIVYLSNHVDVEVKIGETLASCEFQISPHDPEIDRGLVDTRRLTGTAQLHADLPQDQSEPIRANQLPVSEYFPDRVQNIAYTDAVPPGYDLRTRPDPKLLTPGIVLLASGYGASLTLAGIYRFKDDGQLYAIPIVGPALYIPTAIRYMEDLYACAPNEFCEGSAAKAFAPIFFAITTVGFTGMQASGLGLTIAGLVKRKPYWQRVKKLSREEGMLGNVNAAPWLEPGLGGLIVTGDF